MLQIKTEIWCRTCGYYRPVNQMSKGKQSEFNDRINYKLPEGLNGDSSNNSIGGNESILSFS